MIHLSKPEISNKELKAVKKVLKSRKLAQGEEVAKFESEFSELVGERNCIAVNSGTSGLHLSLLASGIGRGDEVIVPSFSFAATANAVALTGAIPIFVDVDERTFNISPKAIENAITPRTKAIQPVHLYGLPADMISILEIAKKHDLKIFEDSAQAHGASISDKNVGEFGDFATFSFYPTKNMTSGEGGMIVTSQDKMARTCRLLRNQGMEKRYYNELVGYNLRMTDIHAAIGRVQLTKLKKFTEKRKRNASLLNNELRNVRIPYVPSTYSHVYHQYTIKVEDRDRFAEELVKREIECGVYYPTPIHMLPSFNQKFELETTSKLCKEVLSIPVHPGLKERDLDKIIKTVNSLAKAGS